MCRIKVFWGDFAVRERFLQFQKRSVEYFSTLRSCPACLNSWLCIMYGASAACRFGVQTWSDWGFNINNGLFLAPMFSLTVKYLSDDSVSDVCVCHAVKQEQNRFFCASSPFRVKHPILHGKCLLLLCYDINRCHWDHTGRYLCYVCMWFREHGY